MRLGRLVTIAAIGASLLVTASSAEAEPAPGFNEASASLSTTQAGAHPDLTTDFTLNTKETGFEDPKGFHDPAGPTKEIAVSLPPGLIGNPMSVPQCTQVQFATAQEEGGGCPQDSQVGLTVFHSAHTFVYFTEPVFLLEPPGGDKVARLGFWGYNVPIYINVSLRPEDEYGLTATLERIPSTFPVITAETTLWGVPASPLHDTERLTVLEVTESGGAISQSPSRASGLAPVPFMTNPTRCGAPLSIGFELETYDQPGIRPAAQAPLGEVTGCGKVDFKPTLGFTTTSQEADSPTGMDVQLQVPQGGLGNVSGFATGALKRTVVRLPRGLRLNPSAASGLGGCGEAQVGLISSSPLLFNRAPAACPETAKVGTAEIHTPLLREPLQGELYVARQGENPFGALLAGYLVAEGQGVVLKVAGRFDLEAGSGRITATFDDNPQQPFDSLRLHFNEGSRGTLINPPTCGSYPIESMLSSWSAADPANPATETVETTTLIPTSSGPSGGPCPSGAFAPSLRAGTASSTAGAYSPFSFDLSRADGTDQFAAVEATPPEGLLGKLAGIPYCPEAAIASISEAEGTGAAQFAGPSCPSASQVGTVAAAAGAGSTPFYLQTGRVYLAGPYKGAPLSLAIVTPALAGPFDLGSVVVRTALYVDQRTTRLTAVSDPIPAYLHGIALDLRELRVAIDRDRFTLNPTNCEPKAVDARITSLGGAKAQTSARFQASSCANLDFKPRLALALKGPTKRSGHPALRATLTYPKAASANIARAQVGLPHSEFLDQGNIKTICTQADLKAATCPRASIYGHAKAWSPLLEKPLEGPVYLVGGYGHKLPDLVADLNGQIRVLLNGKVDTDRRHGIRNTFEAVPDAPVSKFVLALEGGPKKGLIENSEDVCRRSQNAEVRFVGQNGKVETLAQRISNNCKGKPRPKR